MTWCPTSFKTHEFLFVCMGVAMAMAPNLVGAVIKPHAILMFCFSGTVMLNMRDLVNFMRGRPYGHKVGSDIDWVCQTLAETIMVIGFSVCFGMVLSQSMRWLDTKDSCTEYPLWLHQACFEAVQVETIVLERVCYCEEGGLFDRSTRALIRSSEIGSYMSSLIALVCLVYVCVKARKDKSE